MKILLTTSVAILVLLSGCVKTVYLEQETPAGAVPRARVEPPPSLEQGLQGAYAANTMAEEGLDAEAVAERFRGAYLKAQQPRMAVYLNRALSDEVREWKSEERIVVTGQLKAREAYEKTTTSDGNRPAVLAVSEAAQEEPGGRKTLAGQLAADAQYSASWQTRAEDAPRPAVAEAWSWALEDGFSRPFLEAGTKLVDRATILRLTAAEAAGEVAVKQVEMGALKGYADLLVEILVSDRFETAGEYEFRVSVKEVQSGQLLAHATTLYPEGKKHGRHYEATSRGFVAGEKDPYRTGERLALDLMDSLALRWER